MHIPDNYLSPSTCAVFTAAMVPAWIIASKKMKLEAGNKSISSIGMLSAFSFVLMMFNIPLPGGTTGHATGAALIGILAGPYQACIAMSISLLIQALFFGDGGVLAFGANAFNMALVMPFVGYYTWLVLRGFSRSNKWEIFSVFIASYISLNVGAFITALEFGVQPLLFQSAGGLPLYAPYPLDISIPAMMVPHLLVAGVIEGLVAVGIYSFVKKVAPDIISNKSYPQLNPFTSILAIMVFAAPIGLIASGTAWGEWDNEHINKLLGYVPQGMEKGFSFNSMLPDYTVPWVSNESFGYIISALFGLLLIVLVFRILKSLFDREADAGLDQ